MTSTTNFLDVRLCTFSAKLKTVQKTDARRLDVRPFFLSFSIDKRQETVLENFPASQLSDNQHQLLVIETILFSPYIIPAKGLGLGIQCHYVAYVVGNADPIFGGHPELSPMDHKRQGDNLLSPRRNMKTQEWPACGVF